MIDKTQATDHRRPYNRRNVVVYRGVNIYRHTSHEGHKLPWHTVAPSRVADTLEGMRRLIREEANVK